MDKEILKFQNYLKAEKKFIEDAKYFEGINTNKDPGNEFIISWVELYAQKFRDRWLKSKCQHCKDSVECGNKLKEECDKCKEYPNEG